MLFFFKCQTFDHQMQRGGWGHWSFFPPKINVLIFSDSMQLLPLIFRQKKKDQCPHLSASADDQIFDIF
jgi:hypothetical protein